MRIYLRLLPVFLLLGLCACAGSDKGKDDQAPEDEKPVETLYNEAASALDDDRYIEAARLFDEVERQHPYSQWATRAELMAAYAAYKGLHYDEAILALDRFIQLHPGNQDVDYALYLRALCFYEQISDVARDQALTMEALNALQTLVRRFPDSQYARDANLKLDLTLDHLAGKEMEIGRYYLNRGYINAAMNRFLVVVKEYQTTTHVPEALHRLVEAYMTLGLKTEATHVAAVLGYNYPGNKWYERSYKLLDPEQRAKILDERGWVDRTVESIFKPD
ncbi:MAG: outer membrane protein assembly factor BamD [Rhodospirillales bacterium]|nr:outer membrane protein assembly factor BamD [Rhodospirillales bacterium]